MVRERHGLPPSSYILMRLPESAGVIHALKQKLTQAYALDESDRVNTDRIIQLQNVMHQNAEITRQYLERAIQERDQKIHELEDLLRG